MQDLATQNVSTRARWLLDDMDALINALKHYGDRHPEKAEDCEEAVSGLKYVLGKDEDAGVESIVADIRRIIGEVQ